MYNGRLDSGVVTRFAPSPTGFLHLGGARTALFNFLFARKKGGEFLLRIEDTDRERSDERFVKDILNGLTWLGLNWDGEPLFQSSRFELYREEAHRLLKEGLAYKCYCTPEELEEMRRKAMAGGRRPGYDGRCRERISEPSGSPYTIRFGFPRQGETVIRDLIKGEVTFSNAEIDDFIILRSDSTPTYNFVVVVDDAFMGITHILRGDDHLNNTPKQIHLYRGLGYSVPAFGHLPMILGGDRSRLSKRHGATSLAEYREEGILPEAMVNFLARLGWSCGDEEIFSLQELVEKFSIEAVGRSGGVFNREKLLWLNSHYIKNGDSRRIAELLGPFIAGEGVLGEADGKRLVRVVESLRERARTLKEMAERGAFYFSNLPEYEERARGKFLTPRALPFLKSCLQMIKGLPDFEPRTLQEGFLGELERVGIPLRSVAQPLRVALTGREVSPGIIEVMAGLGRERVIERVERAIDLIQGDGGR